MLTLTQQTSNRLPSAWLLLGLWCFVSSVSAQDSPAAPSAALEDNIDPVTVAANKVMRADLQTRSDSELTELTARWDALSASERRALLAEVRSRMARSKTPAAVGLRQRIRITRQYGQVKRDRLSTPGVVKKTLRIRQPDGSVVVRTEVVRVTPDSIDVPDGQVSVQRTITFGTGYERRVQRTLRPADPALGNSPVVTVTERERARQAQ